MEKSCAAALSIHSKLMSSADTVIRRTAIGRISALEMCLVVCKTLTEFSATGVAASHQAAVCRKV